jgi:ABC-type nitrate/sulfonate/bicarbonate transport system substrate-binding protein
MTTMVSSLISKAASPLRFGYVPLVDCAPLAVARETGIFDHYCLNVSLSREIGWASIRDKMVYGQLDAAQSIAGIAIALALGITEMRCEISVQMILNLHGNAITLSTDIGPEQIGKGEQLKAYLTHMWKKDRPFTMAVTHRYSSHHVLLKIWLQRLGLHAPEDVQIIFLPPALMPRHLKADHIDGYCVGEPWNSESILAGTGWCPATSADLSLGHPEKVLMLSGSYLNENRDESINLVAALLDACMKCEDPSFREDLVSILALPDYTGADPDVLRNSLGPTFNSGFDRRPVNGFHVFHGGSLNRPSTDKASWVLAGMRDTGTLPDTICGSISRIFREDIFLAAGQSMAAHAIV